MSMWLSETPFSDISYRGMNFISHHEAAKIFIPDASPSLLFGSFFDDVARTSKSRKIRSFVLNPDMRAGMVLHNLTNRYFDALPEIKQLEADMIESFRDFQPWRQSIQASHVGKDLLFDGTQFDKPLVLAGFLTTLNQAIGGEVDFSGIDDPSPFIQVATWATTHGLPRYDQPEVVAEHVYRVLGNTRTPLDRSVFDQVVELFDSYQPRIMSLGSLAMDQTIDCIRNHGDYS